MNEYRVLYDEEFVTDAASHYRGRRKVYPWFIVVKALCFLGLTALLVVCLVLAVQAVGRGASGGVFLVSLVPALFIFLLMLGPRVDYALMRRRLKKSPFYGGEAHICVAESGVSVRTPRSDLSLSWAAFTHVKRLANGFMLFSGPDSWYWWPDSALASGTVGDVERLLRISVPSYEPSDA